MYKADILVRYILTNSMTNAQPHGHRYHHHHHHVQGDIDAGVGSKHILTDEVVFCHQIANVHIGQSGVVVTERVSAPVTLDPTIGRIAFHTRLKRFMGS